MQESRVPSPEGWGLARRALVGCLLVVAVTAAATATAILLEVGNVAGFLKQNPRFALAPRVLAATHPGQPQTLLLVGDDRRPPPKGKPDQFVLPHSNEMLLVRLDPARPTISMLSIPRDLKVAIFPHHAARTVKRINVAYTIGGIQLMTETVKRVLGVAINHVVVITFPHFKRAVNEMGCVYTTVDRRYFHSNAHAAAGDKYFEINLQPGYQKLCGTQALQFVAYRHGDTALIRDARDQRFLLDVKSQYGPTLFANRDKFERIFGKAVQTDLHGTHEVLDLLELLIQMSGHPVRQIHFNATPGPIFVTATGRQIHQSVKAFLHGVAPLPKHRFGAIVRSAGRRHHRRQALALLRTPRTYLHRARRVARHLPFALEYPRVRNQYPGAGADRLRVYGIRAPNGHVHVAYSLVIDRGLLGEFYDVQGTGWPDPPLLNNPSQTVRIGQRTYGLYFEGDKLRTIAWREGKAVYWIANTLIDSVGPREMLAMAQQTLPVSGRAGLAGGQLKPRNFVLPRRASTVDGLTMAGALLGFVALLGIAVLSVRLFSGTRALRELRAECELLERQEAALRVRRIGPVARPEPPRAAGGPDSRAAPRVPAGTPG